MQCIIRYSLLPARLVLTLLYVSASVCVCGCMCVCLSAIITCAKLLRIFALKKYLVELSAKFLSELKLVFREPFFLTSFRYYATIATSAVEATGSLQTKVRQARLVLCCLDGERVVGNDESSFGKF